MSKVAIVYFSETNNTKTAAEYVAGKIDAKLIRVEGKGNTNPLFGMLKASIKPLNEPWNEVSDCDKVLLMAPIYAFSGIPVVRGFLSKADLTDKEVMIVSSGADSSGKLSEKVSAQYAKLIEKANGKVGPCVYHQGGDFKKFAGEERIQTQVDGVIEQIVAWVNQ